MAEVLHLDVSTDDFTVDNFSLGHAPLKIPALMPANREYHSPSNLKAEGFSMGVKVTWDHNYGMTSYMVKWKTEGQKEWTEQPVTTNRMDSITATSGIKYQYQVCSCHGDRCSRYSKVVEAVSDRNTALPPTSIRTVSLDGAFTMDWSPPEGSNNWNITEYELSFRNMDQNSYTSVGSKRFSEKITGFFGLPAGSIWTIRMATWTYPEGGGLYEYARPVLVGGGKPTRPHNLHARFTSHTSAQLTWNASVNAAGYLVYTRSARDRYNGTFETDGIVRMGEPRTDMINLVLGRGQYEFCVSAVNGETESAKSECVAPGMSNVDRYPRDWLRSLSMYSTVWFCALLMVAVFLATSQRRRRKEPLGILEGIELAEDQKPSDAGIFVRDGETLFHDR